MVSPDADAGAPLITVRGEAQREGPPELATVGVTVHSSASDAALVRSELAHASAAIRALIERRGAALESSATRGLHVSPVFRQRGAKITGYRGSFTAEVVLHDLAEVPALIADASTVPGAEINGPWWSLRPGSPLFREARLAAIDDARNRAADYAAAFGGRVGEVVEISDLEGGFGPRPERFYRAADMMMSGGEPPELDLEPAVQTVAGQVTVRFTLRR